MAAVFDHQAQRIIELRSCVIVEPRCLRETAQDIERRDCRRSRLDHAEISERLVAHLLEELILERARAFIRAEDLRLNLLQLRRDEALAADGGLLPRVMRRHGREIRLRDLDEVTEDRVEPYLERL